MNTCTSIPFLLLGREAAVAHKISHKSSDHALSPVLPASPVFFVGGAAQCAAPPTKNTGEEPATSSQNNAQRVPDNFATALPLPAAMVYCFMVDKERKFCMDLNLKKKVLRTFTYGLYAISCANEGEVNIFTANWLTQVSFDQPLMAVSIENASKSLPMILRSRIFTVNVLRSGDRDLAGKLGKSAMQHPDKLAGIGYDRGENDCP